MSKVTDINSKSDMVMMQGKEVQDFIDNEIPPDAVGFISFNSEVSEAMECGCWNLEIAHEDTVLMKLAEVFQDPGQLIDIAVEEIGVDHVLVCAHGYREWLQEESDD